MVNIKWDELSFSFNPTDYMFIAESEDGINWDEGKLVPFGNISLSPASCVLHYGQGLFEGLKAYKTLDNKIFLFRPENNAKRMIDGCKRLCIPPVSEELFLKGVIEVIKANKDYIPPYNKEKESQGSLYVRPAVWGTGPVLGVAPAPTYTFLIFCCPVGPYFKKGFQTINLKVTKKYHRAAEGGTGAVKAIGNYCGGMLPAREAKAQGLSEVLYLDAKENLYLDEVGAANFFCIKDNTLMTPELNGCILPGNTRNAILKLASEKLNLKIEEKKLKLEEALEADEAFASGTAAVISPIGSIHYEDKEYKIKDGEIGEKTRKIYKMLLNIQHGIEPDIYGWIKVVE